MYRPCTYLTSNAGVTAASIDAADARHGHVARRNGAIRGPFRSIVGRNPMATTVQVAWCGGYPSACAPSIYILRVKLAWRLPRCLSNNDDTVGI
jgi:hypothetical protein